MRCFSKCTSHVVVIPALHRFSKFYSRVVVIRTCGPCCSWLATEAGVPAGQIHWASNRPSAKSLTADAEGKAGKSLWRLSWSKRFYDT